MLYVLWINSKYSFAVFIWLEIRALMFCDTGQHCYEGGVKLVSFKIVIMEESIPINNK